jgi:hypothetical protein
MMDEQELDDLGKMSGMAGTEVLVTWLHNPVTNRHLPLPEPFAALRMEALKDMQISLKPRPPLPPSFPPLHSSLQHVAP